MSTAIRAMAPTTHKYLMALQSKGDLYIGRESVSGFFIRLFEWIVSAETVIEKASKFCLTCMVSCWTFHWRLDLLLGVLTENPLGSVAQEDYPQASILRHDFIIFLPGKGASALRYLHRTHWQPHVSNANQ